MQATTSSTPSPALNNLFSLIAEADAANTAFEKTVKKARKLAKQCKK